jgi:predicted AlkP superfamily phosphohydrolase/phosphomutase
MPERALLIGLDGADWRVLRPLVQSGLMPHLGTLIDNGVSGDLRSTLPTNSAVAWPSFMTGRNAGKHGVFDFTLRVARDRTLLAPADSRSIRSETFLGTLGRHGRRVGAINVPVTYPPSPVNGFLLGGMFVEDGRPYTFPEGLAGELDDQVGGFLPNRIRWRYMLGRFEELLDEAIAVTRQRARVLEYLATHKTWDVLVQVFVSPDRLAHPLMHVLDPNHPRHDPALAHRLDSRLRAYWTTIDDILGLGRRLVGTTDNLIVLSDHGLHSVRRAVYVREMLERAGFARVAKPTAIDLVRQRIRPLVPQGVRRRLRGTTVAARPGGSPQGMAGLDWPGTRAFVTTGSSQGVFINVLGREPHGIVPEGDAYQRILDEIRELLTSERDPATGERVIAAVHRGRDVYRGPLASAAPDLIYEPAPGYAVAKGAPRHLAPYDWFMGDHDRDGILVATGPGIHRGRRIDGASLLDIAPTVLYLAGVPIPEEMDGTVLSMFGDGRLESHPPAYEHEWKPSDQPDTGYTQEEEERLEEQLRSLGYL